MEQLDKFISIFAGLDSAYGTYRVEGQNEKGKNTGKASVVRQPPTKNLWQRHFDGLDPSLGIIPIRANNSCTWGAIDVDRYPLDHAKIIADVKKLDLPLVTFRSKSGGAHIYCFTRAPVPAGSMQKYLTACAGLLGEAGQEIFPKQSEILVERGDTGNYLNLPYFGGEKTLRYAFKDNGESATLEEFFALYEEKAQDKLIFPEASAKPDDPVSDGPPCLQALCKQGFPEGSRNNGMFSTGLYLKKAFPFGWEDKLLEFNHKYFNPPLGLQELGVIQKQLERKDYRYKCKDDPIKSFCNPSLCRQRKHGIGGDGPGSPQLTSLSKYASEPPLWFLDVNGKRLELETENLFNQLLFQKACMDKLNILPPTIKKPDWEQLINELLSEMVELEQITEASTDTTISGRFRELVEEFTTHLQQGMDRDEILMGRVWTDEDSKVVYLRIKDLEAHLRRNNFGLMSAPKMAQRLRELGGEPCSLKLKGRTTRVWSLPVFEQQDSTFDTPIASDRVPF